VIRATIRQNLPRIVTQSSAWSTGFSTPLAIARHLKLYISSALAFFRAYPVFLTRWDAYPNRRVARSDLVAVGVGWRGRYAVPLQLRQRTLWRLRDL